MSTKHFWEVECKMTCLGGSEEGTCACTHPKECRGAKEPGYQEARDNAVARMLKYLQTGVDPTKANKVLH